MTTTPDRAEVRERAEVVSALVGLISSLGTSSPAVLATEVRAALSYRRRSPAHEAVLWAAFRTPAGDLRTVFELADRLAPMIEAAPGG